MPPARVITIFNHGTGSHRNRHDGEIISVFGRCMYKEILRTDGAFGGLSGPIRGSNEYYDYVITDGPGSDTSLDEAKLYYRFSDKIKDAYNPMPGKFVPDFDIDLLEGERTKYKTQPPPMKKEKPKLMRTTTPSGGGTGAGWEDNVCHIISFLEYLADLKPHHGLPRVINMIGWSRGAVTCIKQADAIYNYLDHKKRHISSKEFSLGTTQSVLQGRLAKFRQIELNLFLIDPVAGEGNRHYDVNRVIYPNVKNIVVTLAMHEKRTGFEPQDFTGIGKDDTSKVKKIANLRTSPGPRLVIQNPLMTNYILLPFPGRHNTQVRRYLNNDMAGEDIRAIRHFRGSEKVANDDMTGPSFVVWNLAWAFLNHHGTRFRDKPVVISQNGTKANKAYAKELNAFMGGNADKNAEKLLEEYTKMICYMAHYYEFLSNFDNKANRAQSMGAKPRVRHFLTQLSMYVKYPGFFVNEHHRWLFRSLYPSLYKKMIAYIEDGTVFTDRPAPKLDKSNETFCNIFDRYFLVACKDAGAYAEGKLYKDWDRTEKEDMPTYSKSEKSLMKLLPDDAVAWGKNLWH